jgi:cellulose biosynthesis protein BcsQ
MTTRQEEHADIDDIVIPVKDNFFLAPSSIMLSSVEQELSGIKGRENRLLHAFGAQKQRYDYIIVDCPPSIGHLCFNALRACEEVIIPIDMSLFSLRGVAKLLEIIILFKTELDHNIKIRALITMYDFRTRYSRRVLDKVKEVFGNNVFETVIRYNVRLRETVDYGLPVGDYEKLSDEILSPEFSFIHTGSSRVNSIQEILRRTEHYIDTAGNSPAPDLHESEPDESYSHPVESSYSDMIDAMTMDSDDSFFEKDDTAEEFM